MVDDLIRLQASMPLTYMALFAVVVWLAFCLGLRLVPWDK